MKNSFGMKNVRPVRDSQSRTFGPHQLWESEKSLGKGELERAFHVSKIS